MSLRTCIVTGAAKPGIGEAVTLRLLAEGFSVIGTYEADDQASAEALKKREPNVNRLRLSCVDHSSRQSLSEFVSNIKNEIVGIVHAQFFFAMENPDQFDHELWDKSIAVNLTGANFVTHELKKRMHKGGSIVFVTSTEGFIGSFGASAYAATRAAIHNLVKTFANNLGNRGIRANAIAAGWIGGVMDTDEVFNISRKITPLGRLGTPEEIASTVFFLLSDASSFVNGSVITADGGYTGVDTIAKYEFEHDK